MHSCQLVRQAGSCTGPAAALLCVLSAHAGLRYTSSWPLPMQAPLDPHSFITQRLINPCSAEAASMRLRPQLQMAAQSLLAMLSKTATTPGDNSSTLLIGQRGVGKTLVSHGVCCCLGSAVVERDCQSTYGREHGILCAPHCMKRHADRQLLRGTWRGQDAGQHCSFLLPSETFCSQAQAHCGLAGI